MRSRSASALAFPAVSARRGDKKARRHILRPTRGSRAGVAVTRTSALERVLIDAQGTTPPKVWEKSSARMRVRAGHRPTSCTRDGQDMTDGFDLGTRLSTGPDDSYDRALGAREVLGGDRGRCPRPNATYLD